MICAIIQARMGSTRLPNKVLMEVNGRPLLSYMIERVKAAETIDEVVIATSSGKSDDPIAIFCQSNKIICLRGSLEDVLDRYYQTAVKTKCTTVVRLTGDCPLIDPKVIDTVVKKYETGNYDYVANTAPPENITFPEGMDVEVFSFKVLKKAWEEAKKPSDREHVTFYFWKNTNKFSTYRYDLKKNYSRYRLTIDYPEDYEVIKVLIAALYPKKKLFSMLDIINYLDSHEDVMKINQNIKPFTGWTSAFQKDKLAGFVTCDRHKSLEMQKRARARIPGGVQLLSKRPEMFAPGQWPGYYSKATGAEVWDLDGNKYIDMSISGIGANVLGFADPDVNEAVIDAINRGNSASLNCYEEVELADLLCEMHPWAGMVRYGRTGGEAMAIAVRIARAHSKRDVIAFCGYHGWHDWYLASNISKSDNLDEQLLPGLSPLGVPRSLAGTSIPFRYNKIEELEDIVKNVGKNLGAIVMEPLRDVYPSPGFLERIREIADETGAVLVFDEITAGLRLNSCGAHMNFKVKPDIAVFAKAISNGFPMAAIIGAEKVMQSAQTTFISSTYWTERIGPVAALATIKKHRKFDVSKHLMKTGKRIQEGWKKAADQVGLKVQVSGIFPLSHFNFEHKDKQAMVTLFTQLMLDKGYLASGRFYASYAHKNEHVEGYLTATRDVFNTISIGVKKGNIMELLNGPVAHDGFKRLT